MDNKKKLKKRKGQSGERIKAREVSNPQYDKRHPLFSLKYLENKYCVSRCEKNDKALFAETLRKIGQCTWQELKLSPKHGLGYEKINIDSLNVAIPPFVTKDTHIIAFRFSGKKPMIGYKKKEIFYIIWLDRNYKVYNH